MVQLGGGNHQAASQPAPPEQGNYPSTVPVPSGRESVDGVDVVVVGSGFGGSVAAYRLAAAGQSVVLMERGKAYPPGSFARSPADMGRNFWDPDHGLYGPFDAWTFRGAEVIVSSGLGGGSLIYANILLRKDERWFVRESPVPGGGYSVHGAASLRTTCILCGECDIGCNTGAKNTLDHNYLSAAKSAGADVRTYHDVRGVRPLDGGGYEVRYVIHDPANPRPLLTAHTIRTRRLVLGAGTFGTNFLLLRNRASLPALTPVSCPAAKAPSSPPPSGFRTPSTAATAAATTSRTPVTLPSSIGSSKPPSVAKLPGAQRASACNCSKTASSKHSAPISLRTSLPRSGTGACPPAPCPCLAWAATFPTAS